MYLKEKKMAQKAVCAYLWVFVCECVWLGGGGGAGGGLQACEAHGGFFFFF